MEASQPNATVMDVYIISEDTYTGFLDFERSTNAFKAYMYNVA